ncbi:glutathione S-transferase [Mycena epipterygia]|nr:glutathione S-transferase [Mycena epipterygia]
MAILKLYGMTDATCTRRVATGRASTNFPLTSKAAVRDNPLHREHLSALLPHPQLEPQDDDGFILYETRVICRYIAKKHPESGLIPTDLKANAIFEQAAAVEVTAFGPTATRITMETVTKPRLGYPSDLSTVPANLKALDQKLDAYEVILGKQRYIGGDTLTLADFFHFLYSAMLATGGHDIMTQKPNVARWHNELIARPSWLAYQDGVVTTTAY